MISPFHVCLHLQVMVMDPLTRRSRFIIASMFMFGLGPWVCCPIAMYSMTHPIIKTTGVTIVPQWATPNLWPVQPGESSALYSIQTTVMIILTTGFALGAIVGMILHLLMPRESSTAYLEADIAHLQRQLDEARSKESEWSISSEVKTDAASSGSQTEATALAVVNPILAVSPPAVN